MKSTTGIRAIVVGLLALVGVAGAVATADATTPGANGKIAFRRYFDQDHSSGALFTANPDGSDVQQITHPAAGPVLDNEPDWSPDGKQVVFQRNDLNGCGTNCETAEIWVVNADGSNAIAIVKDPVGKGCALDGKPAGRSCRGGPAWSPDGKRIIFECGAPNGPGGFCVANADGSNEATLENSPANRADTGPQFSPDGSRLAFERDIVNGNGDTITSAVFVMNADGGNARRITPWALRAGDHPDWSPAGKRILFHSNQDGPDTISANIYTIRPDGTGLRQLTHARGGTVQHASSSFSPDGKWITFARRTGGGNADVFVMHANGTQVRNVTRSAIWDSAPDWGATG